MPGYDNKPDQDTTSAIRLYESMETERGNIDAYFQELASNIYPRKEYDGSVSTLSRSNRMRKVYDSSPLWALGLHTSALHTMLTNPAMIWFELQPSDYRLRRNYQVRKYLQLCEKILFIHLLQSNFHSQIHENYTDAALFGNAAIYVQRDMADMFRFSSRPLSEVLWIHGPDDRPLAKCRKLYYNAVDMAKEFGVENLHPKVQRELEGKVEDAIGSRHLVVEIILERDSYIPGSWDKTKRRIASVFVDIENKHTISVGGYHEDPMPITRWEVESGRSIGHGPGDVCLPEARLLHVTAKHLIRGTQKATDPALMVPNKAFTTTPLRLSAGAINYYKMSGALAQSGPANAVQAFPTSQRLNEAMAARQDARQRVQDAFFVNDLLLHKGDRMVTLEVSQRIEESRRVLAPVLGRMNEELLAPIVKRCFYIAMRSGAMPQMPRELRGSGIRVKFVSPMAKSQRMSEVQSLQGAISTLTPLAQSDPNMMQVFKRPELVSYVFDAFGAPLSVIEDPEAFYKKIEAAEQAKREEDSMLNQAQGVRDIASAAKDVATAQEKVAGSPLSIMR